MVAVVAFDLSGVVFNDGLSVAVAAIAQEFRLTPDIVREVLNGKFSEDYRQGLITGELFWKKAQQRLGIDNITGLRQRFFDSYSLMPEVAAIVAELRTAGTKAAYLSNGPEDRTAYLDSKYHFRSMFDFGLFSYEAHDWKPNPSFYQEFLRRFALKPQDVLYVDDRAENLVPAAALGMRAIHYQSPQQLRTELKSTDFL